MQSPVRTVAQNSTRASVWKALLQPLNVKNFSGGFWLYFLAVFLFDAGYGVYFFLFNLRLLDLGFSEKLMGWVSGGVTLGSVLAMIPVGIYSKKIGLKPLIIACFVVSPLINAVRTFDSSWSAQIVLAIVAGMAMTMGTVCYLPAVARLTSEENRTAAFSLIISASLIASAFGGVVCGYVPAWMKAAGILMSAADVKRLLLLVSCLIVVFGLFPLVRLRIPEPESKAPTENTWRSAVLHRPSPFLLRFLPLMALWAAVIASFGPFGNVYLASALHVPMSHIGVIFAVVQLIQLCMIIATPIIFGLLGTVRGIVLVQGAAAVMFCVLAIAHQTSIAVTVYLIVSALQWMSSPGLYNLVMSKTPDNERTTAAAATLLCNAIAASAATTCSGALIARYGYPPVLIGAAALAFTATLLVWLLFTPAAKLPSPIAREVVRQEL